MANTNGRPPDFRSEHALALTGGHVATWRRLHNLTQDLVAQRAGVSRGSVARLESGHPGVSLDVFIRVLAVVKSLDSMLDGIDPFNTEFGRMRADLSLRERVTRPARHAKGLPVGDDPR